METPTESSPQTVTSLYAHFPFCEAKCHYCDFFSLPESKTPDPDRYYEAVEKELALHKPEHLQTVFLGGGTPSLVPIPRLASFVEKLPLALGAEVTIEVNPSSVTREKAHAWRAMGINRVSMGVQALNDERLTWLGRVHQKDEAFAALECLSEAGFENISTDYILGVPAQSPTVIREELAELLGRFPQIGHLSAYLLTLKPSNPKFRELPPEEEQLSHLRTAQRVLEEYGFDHYEVSNFSRQGGRSRHNQNYWAGGGYFGVGPSAHAYFPSLRRRTKNWASLEKYRELVLEGKLPIEWSETLDHEQERLEAILLHLRRKEGLDLDWYRKTFEQDLLASRRQLTETFAQRGLVAVESGRLRLTSEGFYLSDQIIGQLS